jgi:hypothetical protein
VAFHDDFVAVAFSEFNAMGGAKEPGASNTQSAIKTAKARELITKYWKEGVGYSNSSAASAVNNRTAWSAAFVPTASSPHCEVREMPRGLTSARPIRSISARPCAMTLLQLINQLSSASLPMVSERSSPEFVILLAGQGQRTLQTTRMHCCCTRHAEPAHILQPLRHRREQGQWQSYHDWWKRRQQRFQGNRYAGPGWLHARLAISLQ